MNKIIVINNGEDLKNKLFQVNKNTNLKLKPGPKCQALDVTIKTNYPIKKNSKFSRSEYHDLKILTDHEDLISSSFNWSAVVLLELAGTFHFKCSSSNKVIWEAFVIVLPEIKISLNSIKCQTILAKNLGPFSEWRKRLTVTKETKYNMIHLTPIQELGSSNSAYSLSNQHKVNPTFKATLDDIKKEIDFMEKKWNILTCTDIVLNHTADNSKWIMERPECSYNMVNSPHLRPAFLLDCSFIWLSKDLMSGLFINLPDKLTCLIDTEEQVQSVSLLLKNFYVPLLKIWELFMVNIDDAIKRYKLSGIPKSDNNEFVIDYDQYERNNAKLISIPATINSVEELRRLLNLQNLNKRNEIIGYLNGAIDNAMNALRYERLNPNGPYYQQPIDENKPLVAPYFKHTNYEKFQISQEMTLMYDNGQHFMAHNGWVMGAAGDTSLGDFASPNSFVYLKRELIAWGDCIKLRYGSGAEEVPYLWSHMKKYVEAQAKVFHGFRLDNCHSTPLHVAEYFVDVARLVRPNIYIMAELFTSSESLDNEYVNRLGITALIRESMSAHNSRELGRLIYRFGGTPVGAFYQPDGIEQMKPQTALAIFYDQTHDNESPIIVRSAQDISATSSIISMANCASGSSRGYDELVPHHINVVKEERLYPSIDEIDLQNTGIIPLRRLLNDQLLRELLRGFNEIFVDQVNEDVIAITRHNPTDGRSIVLIARTAFSKEESSCPIKAIPIQGRINKILFEALLCGDPNKYERNNRIINGLESFKTKIFNLNCHNIQESKLATKLINFPNEDRAEIHLNEFKFLPSSVMAVEICLSDRQSKALEKLNEWQSKLDSFDLTLNDANYILFRCPQEDGCQPYELPGYCTFTYCGIYGLMFHLQKVRENQDQAHPLATNLRQGNWLSKYIVDRLKSRPKLIKLACHLDEALNQVDLLPRGMVPKYFDLIITRLYNDLIHMIYSHMSVFISKGPELVKLLALSSVALIGECESAKLPQLDCNKLNYLPSIAAGLPHFSSGFMRNWGRDTFIAMRGLMLLTGRFNEAKSIILAYGRTLKNGLIPNLLDGGVKSRYNCRDAIWWWLYSIKEYTKLAPNGSEIFRSKIKRLHKPEPPANGLPQRKRSVAQMNGHSAGSNNNDNASIQLLSDVIQESLECHFKGMEFVEENAGKQLDEHMKQEGFTVTFGVKRDNGFVYGGNRWNCGTWMDKMGSSEKAGTKGMPASPRDGSAIEIVGLCKAVISWLDDMHKNGRAYPYDGVECLYDNTITFKWTWKKWASLIQANFEKYFYIPLEDEKTELQDPNPDLINRRGIYKDTVGATIKWQDYQLRPNFLIAMVVAPELFEVKHSQQAILMAKERLCSYIGMRTLDPSDFNYVGDYNNGNDSDDPKVAQGFNYHQGPEWLWLTGYYIMASSKFLGSSELRHHLQTLSNFYATLVETPWFGLPELTNSNGSFCRDSCPIQAWSLGTALEALHESVKNV